MSQLVKEAGEAKFAVSGLVKCECLVGPLKTEDLVLEQPHLDLLNRFPSLEIVEPLYLDAAKLRASFDLKTPDALHLACAQHHGCEALWTHDDRLTRASRGFALNVLTA